MQPNVKSIEIRNSCQRWKRWQRCGKMESEKPLNLHGNSQPLDTSSLERVGMRNESSNPRKKWQKNPQIQRQQQNLVNSKHVHENLFNIKLTYYSPKTTKFKLIVYPMLPCDPLNLHLLQIYHNPKLRFLLVLKQTLRCTMRFAIDSHAAIPFFINTFMLSPIC